MRVTCLIVTYNGQRYIGRCIKSVLASDYRDLEVLVVDNASKDSTPAIVESFPRVRLLRNERNLGFSAAANVGIHKSTGDVVFLLNQDALIEKSCISQLVEAAKRDPDVGVLGCKVYLGETRTLQHAGGRILGSAGAPLIGYGELDKGQYESEREVDYVIGAAFMITRRALEAIGLLPEVYFLYGEEVEYCLRAHKAGMKVVYVPKAVAYHFVNSSMGKPSYRGFYNGSRSRLTFAFRNFEGLKLIRFLGYELAIGSTGVYLMLRQKESRRFLPSYWRAVFRSYFWFARNLRKVLREKNQVKQLSDSHLN